MNNHLKNLVKSHWEEETCGTRYGAATSRKLWLTEIEKTRYEIEPYVLDFADFKSGQGKKVLEIGVGAGVDFSNWIKCGAIATGVDLTEAAIKLANERVKSTLHPSPFTLLVADAENLPFQDNQFDIVYSWGVLHHTPDTPRAFAQAFRVIKQGGHLKAMVYHVNSWTGFMLWVRYCLLKGKPWRGLKYAIFHHLESPGTKAYTTKEMHEMLAQIGFKNIHLSTKLCAGDLLNIKPSAKYKSGIYKIIWALYPRRLVKLLGDRFGLNLLIRAQKS